MQKFPIVHILMLYNELFILTLNLYRATQKYTYRLIYAPTILNQIFALLSHSFVDQHHKTLSRRITSSAAVFGFDRNTFLGEIFSAVSGIYIFIMMTNNIKKNK